MIGIGQAEHLFQFVSYRQLGILEHELKRIGYKNVIELMTPELKSEIYKLIDQDEELKAVSLLKEFPSK